MRKMCALSMFVFLGGVAAIRCQAATVDQQQLVYDGGTSARTLPGYAVWQSFTAGLTGTLAEIDMGFFNDMSGDGTLRIYSGQGTSGAILETVTVPVAGITQPQVTWNDWGVSVPIEAGLQYTFELTPDASTLPDPYGVAIGTANPYAGGLMGLNDPSGTYPIADFDLVFQTKVSTSLVSEPASIILLVFGLIVFAANFGIGRRTRCAIASDPCPNFRKSPPIHAATPSFYRRTMRVPAHRSWIPWRNGLKRIVTMIQTGWRDH